MINIFVNKQINILEENTTLLQLIEKINFTHECYAIALNKNFIPRSEYAQIFLQEQDRVDIVTPMQGG